MNKKILIVEDEPPLRAAMKENLKRRGFTVLEASNGQEGLEIALKQSPDMVILDLLMPVMDGITMLNKLRADPAGKNMKVMVTTNLSDVEKASQTAGLGILDYLVKSDWKLKDIADRISKALER